VKHTIVAALAEPDRAFVRHARPDPTNGLIETLLIRDGACVAAAEHLNRLGSSSRALGLTVPSGLAALIERAAAPLESGYLRVALTESGVELSAGQLPLAGPTVLRPVVLPGGLGPHKWGDRSLIDSLSRGDSTPLFCDLDGQVLEAGYAAVLIVIDDVLIAPPLDGRILPSISRRHVLEAAPAAGMRVSVERFTLEQARAADAVLLTSALRGLHPGALSDGPSTAASDAFCLRFAWR
jgi:branched-subunit amino acid aminotransferase/4-amino-4-deoxychorismate lyase